VKVTPIQAKRKNVVNISVKTLTGKQIDLQVNGTDSIEQVKEMIKDSVDIPFNETSLILAGRQLEDGRTINDYAIKMGNILHLVNRRQYEEEAKAQQQAEEERRQQQLEARQQEEKERRQQQAKAQQQAEEERQQQAKARQQAEEEMQL
jgi:regulator of protease activity HflC (stomatin/prohibitin superfamily)